MLPICNDREAVRIALRNLDAEAAAPAAQARLVRMRARGEGPSGLRSSGRWRDATAVVAELGAAPTLTLSDKPS